MAEPYLVQMVKEGREKSGRLTGYTLAELFGEAVTVAAEGSRLTENARVIGGILFTEVVMEKISARAGGYRAAGKLALPQGWEYYDSYVEGISDFSGNAVCTQTTQGWRVDFELTAPLAKKSSFLLSLKGHWQGQGGETQSSEAYAELVYQVRLDAVGELKLHHRLLRGNAWTYYADFEPPLRPSSVAGFIGSLVGIQDITNIVKIPEGMPGLDFLAISGLRLMLSPARTLRGIEILLTVGETWKPSVPYFKAKELGISLYFSIPAGGVERVTCSGGVFGTFLMQITSDFRLRLDLWGYIPELTIEGELLVWQAKKETVLLGDVLSSYGMPQADIGKLTVAGARYIASIPGRSFDLEFFIDSREMLSFSILGLTIAITEISGQISYDPAAFALMLSGEIQIGRTNPFTLGLTFDYDCEEIWKRQPQLFLRIRAWMCGEYKDAVAAYSDLFWLPYPIITAKELRNISGIEVVLKLYDREQMAEDEEGAFISYCNRQYRPSREAFSIFKFIAGMDETVIEDIFYALDMKKVKFAGMSKERKKEIVKELQIPLNLTDAEAIVRFMDFTGCLMPELEREIAEELRESDNEKLSRAYVAAINKMGKVTAETIKNILAMPKLYYFSDVINEELYARKHYTVYVSSRTRAKNAFAVEYERMDVLWQTYLTIMKSANGYMYTRPHMYRNKEFLKMIQDRGDYKGFPEESRMAMAGILQDEKNLEEALTYGEDFVIRYHSGIAGFQSKQAADKFVKIMKKYPQYAQNKQIYDAVHDKLIDGNLKRAYTNLYKRANGH